MHEQSGTGEKRAALVQSSGPNAGVQYPLSREVTRIGRGTSNDIVLKGPAAAVVSANHAEIRNENGVYRIVDCGSTNGTFIDGQRVDEAVLDGDNAIQFGPGGPAMAFVFLEQAAESEPSLDRTLEAPQPAPGAVAAGTALAREDEPLVREAVLKARFAQASGDGDQTSDIVREVVAKAVHRRSKRLAFPIVGLTAALVLVTVYGWEKVRRLNDTKAVIDAQITGLERRLTLVQNPAEADALISSLNSYQTQGQALQQSFFYRWNVWSQEGTVLHEIRTLLSEFGAEAYSVPPDFEDQVNKFLKRYSGPDRPNMQLALGEASPMLGRIRNILYDEKLPRDLAYMVLVESALDANERSRAGCLGLWQFTPDTAKACGLKVGGRRDERLDVAKSTRAAAKYIKGLILDFGTGSSVMLALAAYNVGPNKVKQAIRQRVEDPIKQRSFWYLYRIRALPEETREYVPKVFAAMIIGRRPASYGF